MKNTYDVTEKLHGRFLVKLIINRFTLDFTKICLPRCFTLIHLGLIRTYNVIFGFKPFLWRLLLVWLCVCVCIGFYILIF